MPVSEFTIASGSSSAPTRKKRPLRGALVLARFSSAAPRKLRRRKGDCSEPAPRSAASSRELVGIHGFERFVFCANTKKARQKAGILRRDFLRLRLESFVGGKGSAPGLRRAPPPPRANSWEFTIASGSSSAPRKKPAKRRAFRGFWRHPQGGPLAKASHCLCAFRHLPAPLKGNASREPPGIGGSFYLFSAPTRKKRPVGALSCWRREEDSNLRTSHPRHTISNRAP